MTGSGDDNARDSSAFRWPPRPLDQPARPADASNRESTPSARPHSSSAPARADSAAVTPRAAPSSADIDDTSRESTFDLRSLWHDAERTWLGWTSAPLHVRLRDAQWRPDAMGDYCGRCGRTAVTGPHSTDCARCAGARLSWEQAVRLGSYEGVLRDAIHEVKFSRWRRIGRDLGAMLGEALAQRLDAARISFDDVAIVPMPTSFRRRMARGIDHALVIARGAAAVCGLPIARPLVRRHGPPQMSVPGSRRAGNVAGKFEVRAGGIWSSPLLVVVDDVMTTGATMRAACRTLERGLPRGVDGPGPRLWAAVLGVTELGAGDGLEKRA